MMTSTYIGESKDKQYSLLGHTTLGIYEGLHEDKGLYKDPFSSIDTDGQFSNDEKFEYFSEHDKTVGKHEETEKSLLDTLIHVGIRVGIGIVVLVGAAYIINGLITGNWTPPVISPP